MLLRLQRAAMVLLLAAFGCATRPPPTSALPITPPCNSEPTQPKKFNINCALKVKGGTLAELQRSMAAAQTCLTVKVEPMGFRIFDIAQTRLTFDAAKQELQVRLNDTVCAKQHAALTGAVARVAVCALDCFHFFDVDTTTGVARQQERYDVDYVLEAKPGQPFSEWSKVSLQINDKPADWEDFIGEGVKFDWLPPVVKIKIEGTDANGQRQKVEISFKNATLHTLLRTRAEDE
ncbi:MAG: hypothetical protein NTY53_20605 [Kiritimatiellaeota bacterium]|nr:hypothetical protein [Kiritimatiellota bacterium]